MTQTNNHKAVPQWSFGDRLRRARLNAEMSRAEVADRLGVPTRRYTGWEADQFRPRDLVAVAQAMSVITGVSTEWLLGLDDELTKLNSPFSHLLIDKFTCSPVPAA